MRIFREHFVLALGSIFGLLIIACLLIYGFVFIPKQKVQAWDEFQNLSDSLKLSDLESLGSNSESIGCFKGDASSSACFFTAKQYYVIGSGFNAGTKRLLDYYQSNGYVFKDENQRWRYESTINNKNILDDLSNATPFLVALTNKEKQVDINISVSDVKRFNPKTKTTVKGLNHERADQLAENQLVASISIKQKYTQF